MGALSYEPELSQQTADDVREFSARVRDAI
jgi:hypothetical protein